MPAEGGRFDVAAWLRDLGLERYEAAFGDNAVDGEALPDLTDADLEKLGVLLGHRKRLLKAIAALRAPAAGQAGAAVPSDGAPDVRSEARPAAERRRLTVMFVDLVGSTALSGRLDPEEMREVLRSYQDAVAGAVARFGGHVAKLMGDGVLAYFGWPSAHEDDAERAVRAGLGAVEAVPRLSTPAGGPLAARVGIATGLVVVGDLVGEGGAREEAVVGETPNLAARLQEMAEPGTVAITDATGRLLGQVFELRGLGAVRLKGFARPVPCFRVAGERPSQSRFDARQPDGPPPMVGRDQELALVLERWRQAAAGEGQAVLLVGEAGIGKSRLVQAVLDAVAAGDHVALRYQCSPHHTGTALWPVARQLGFAADLSPGEPEAARLDKLEALLRQGMEDVGEAAPLVAALLGIDVGDRYPRRELAPQQQRLRTLAALVEQLLGLARRHPVLMVLEDAHWIDPTTLELLGLALDRIAGARALMLLTSRPDNQPSLGGHPHMTRLTLNRLGRGPTEAIVAGLAGGRNLPSAVLGEIAARTDGVPLFVEELTKAVLEAGTTEAGAAVPASLHATLMARLDRVPGVKEVAQVAACLGREFAYPLLAAVSPSPEAELRAALDRLAAAELVFARGEPPEASYAFKHALVRDAAYESLLRAERQRLHARIARVLEERSPEAADTEPELLARHCTEAGLHEKAVDYWRVAARLSVARSAMAEAVVQSRKGLDVLKRLPTGDHRWRGELELQGILAAGLVATIGNAAKETGEAYARARSLCEEHGDAETLAPVLSGLCTYHQTRGEFASLRQIALELLQLGQEDEACELIGNRSMALCLFHLGDFAPAHEHFERVLRVYRPEAHRALVSIAAFDMRAVALSYLALDLLALGLPAQARRRDREAVAWARTLSHPHTLAFTLHYSAVFHLIVGDASLAEQAIDELRALAGEHRFSVWLAGADAMRGCLLAGRGARVEGFALARDGLAGRTASGSIYHQTFFLGLVAERYGHVGELDEAHGLLGTALAIASDIGERWFEAELHRLKGEFLLALSEQDRPQAEACLQRALAVARAQGARTWELRAASSLARLWLDQGRRVEAHDLLAPICDWFTEGFDVPDLVEAKRLIGVTRDCAQ